MSRINRPTSLERLEDRRLFAASTIPSQLGGADRGSIDFTQDWSFIKSDAANAQNPATSTSGWSTVDLPHTYNATDGQNGDGTPAGKDENGNDATGTNSGGDYYRGATWYRKNFTYSKSWDTRRIYINVEAAAIKADLYVNGQFVMTHKGDYSGWTADISNYVSGSGKQNTVAIRVDNTQDNDVAGYRGDFTKFGGLTRGVTIFSTNKLHVNSASYGASGIKISQNSVSSSNATIDIGVGMRNDNVKTVGLIVRTSLLDAKGKVVKQVSTNVPIAKRSSLSIHQTLSLANPHLWNGTADPYLYTAYVQVIQQNGSVIDTLTEKVGFRSFTTNSEAASLNGKKIQLRGANLHDDWEDKGPATTYTEKLKDLQLLKDMGANAVRFAHWQVDDDYYKIADQLGLLVWTEIPLWGGNVNSGSAAFNDNAEQQLRELIRQSYNHASIVYWGLFNEITSDANNLALINRLQNVVDSEDPTRKTIAASDEENNVAINDATDLVTLNKYWGWYIYGDSGLNADQRLAEVTNWLAQNKDYLPNKPIGYGEYGAGANVDQHVDWSDVTDNPPTDPNNAQTQPEEYQAYLHEKTWQQIKNASDFVFSAFVWEFADSANDDRLEGSLPGINTKGLVSHDRKTLKDSYYYYKTQWSRTPTLWLTSKDYTDRPTGTATVKAYSNLGVASTLYVDGSSVSSQTPVNGILSWSINLTSGEHDIEVRSVVSGKTYSQTATWTGGVSSSRTQSVNADRFIEAAAVSTERDSRADDIFGSEATIL